VSKKLSITSWNVNGLFKRVNGDRICKLDDHQFSEVMNSDILTFSETHASSDDILAYNGFKSFTLLNKPLTFHDVIDNFFDTLIHIILNLLDKNTHFKLIVHNDGFE
jgi:hypothetical protein